MKQETTVVIKCINYYRHHHYHHCYYHWFINFQFKKQIFHIVYDHLLQKLIFIFPVHTTLILLNLTSLLLRSLALKAPFKPGNWRQKKRVMVARNAPWCLDKLYHTLRTPDYGSLTYRLAMNKVSSVFIMNYGTHVCKNSVCWCCLQKGPHSM